MSRAGSRTRGEVLRYESDRYRAWDQRLLERREARTVETLLARAAARGDRILDIPCGYGRFTRELSRRGSVLGADLRLEMVRRARERFGGVPPRSGPVPEIGYCVTEIERLPFPDGAFEGAVAIRLLQHFRQARRRLAALSELARVSSRWVLVSAYSRAPLHRLTRRAKGVVRKDVPQGRLVGEMEEAGLAVMCIRRPLPGLHSQTFFLLRPHAPG
ncbi:MAG: class I SAM-dependent methyltransferase [Gemmatimonadota bacterium]